MAPTLLVIGATGNTGRSVAKTFAADTKNSPTLKDYRIIGLTRDAKSDASKALAQHLRVEMIEKNWMEIDAKWLREHEIKRIFVASPNGPTHFIDETQLHKHSLDAQVEYIVRISTTTSNVHPDTPVFYGRAHWAIEKVLESCEFDALRWTSLQPTGFTSLYAGMASGWLKQYRETGKASTLPITLDSNIGGAIVDPVEVGIVAGKLLAQENIAKHASQKYIVVGPEDITGKQYKELLEKHAGIPITDVSYRDTSFIDGLKGQGVQPDRLLESLRNAPVSTFDGRASIKVTPTSPNVMELYVPRNSVHKAIDDALSALQRD